MARLVVLLRGLHSGAVCPWFKAIMMTNQTGRAVCVTASLVTENRFSPKSRTGLCFLAFPPNACLTTYLPTYLPTIHPFSPHFTKYKYHL
jgi:hypothetical protein